MTRLRTFNEDKPAPVFVDQMLRTRRRGDRASDLWTAFNVVQENAIRGGLYGYTRTADWRSHLKKIM